MRHIDFGQFLSLYQNGAIKSFHFDNDCSCTPSSIEGYRQTARQVLDTLIARFSANASIDNPVQAAIKVLSFSRNAYRQEEGSGAGFDYTQEIAEQNLSPACYAYRQIAVAGNETESLARWISLITPTSIEECCVLWQAEPFLAHTRLAFAPGAFKL